MIGNISSDYEKAVDIYNKIQILKIVKYVEHIYHLYGYHQITYLYSDNEQKIVHEANMLANGWYKIDSQSSVILCDDTEDENNAFSVSCAIYEKKI